MTGSKLRLLAVLGTATLLAFTFAPGPAPAPWTAQDIGGPGVPGSTTFDPATGGWTLIGGGGDIWGGGDQFHMASMPLTGDITVTARVITQGNTDVWAKAGVMIRESNAAGSTFAMAAITPGNGTIVQWRDTTGGGAAWPGAGASGAVPMWERINRTGNVFTGYYSLDGTTWSANGNVTIAMAASVLAGLEVTSHNNGVSSTVTYDSVSIVNGAGLFYWPLTPPTNLVATNAINSVGLSWTASPTAASYIISRSTMTGGPYTPLPGGTTTGTTFTDNTAANPNTYFYVVQAVQGAMTSVYSNEVTGTPLPPAVSALPNTGLQTNENGAQTQFDIKFNQAAGAGVVVTVKSNNVAEGAVSTTFAAGIVTPLPAGDGFTVQVAAGTSPTITVIVTGVDDALVDGNVPYTVSVAASNMGGVVIPDVQLTNNDNDVAGITLSRTAGLVTSENLTTDSFTVVLNKKPFGNVTMTLASTNMAEGTVFPLTVVLSPTDYNLANQHIVTVTGVDDAVLDFTQPYTIITNPLTFSDPRDANAFALAGATNPPDVACVNVDNEAIPALDHVWGKGGCGLTGLEVVLLLGAGAAWRRRRRIA